MDRYVFVHASDIQLLDGPTVDRVIEWRPDILLAAGPPLYLDRLSEAERETARENALRLATSIDVVILDHHLMRSEEGAHWLDALSSTVGRTGLLRRGFHGAPAATAGGAAGGFVRPDAGSAGMARRLCPNNAPLTDSARINGWIR